MKLAAVIVIFNPKYEDLLHNIRRLEEDVDVVVLYQNSLFDLNKLQYLSNKVVLLGNGVNVGIAKALNDAADWSLNNRYDYLLTLDQDSYFLPLHLSAYKELIISHIQKVGNAIFGPNIRNWGKLQYSEDVSAIKVLETITSGSILATKLIQEHKFEESLFIDAVDYEYCFRLGTMGIQTIIFTNIVLEHQVGEPIKTIFGFKTNNYSAFRTYFLVRNQLIIWKRYPKLFSKSYKRTYVNIHLLQRAVKIVLGEKDKKKKLKAIIFGLIHGFQNKTGYYNINK